MAEGGRHWGAQVKSHLNLPNQLTILRLLLVPVIAVSLAIKFTDHYQVDLVVTTPSRPYRQLSTAASP